MYRCIVAPVDGTAFGEHALPLAAAIAKRSGAILHIAHVHVPLIAPSAVETVAFRGAWNDVTKEEARGYLDGLVERVREAYGIRVDSTLGEGSVAHTLEEYARACGASLVVMSTHGHTRFRRLWHHGVAEHLARELPIPVLLVRPANEEAEPDLACDPQVRHVLVPLDGTRYAEAILPHAVALGRTFQTHFTLLRIVRPPSQGGYARHLQARRAEQAELEREHSAALHYLNVIAERMRAAGLRVRAQVLTSDDPAAAIVAFARASTTVDGPVDLIAMETHPHRPVARILGAHTADRVLHESPVPVLLFEAVTPAEERAPQPSLSVHA